VLTDFGVCIIFESIVQGFGINLETVLRVEDITGDALVAGNIEGASTTYEQLVVIPVDYTYFELTEHINESVYNLWFSNYGGFASDATMVNGIDGPNDGEKAFSSGDTRNIRVHVASGAGLYAAWTFNMRCVTMRCLTVEVLSELCDVKYDDVSRWNTGYEYETIVTCSRHVSAPYTFDMTLTRHATDSGQVETLDVIKHVVSTNSGHLKAVLLGNFFDVFQGMENAELDFRWIPQAFDPGGALYIDIEKMFGERLTEFTYDERTGITDSTIVRCGYQLRLFAKYSSGWNHAFLKFCPTPEGCGSSLVRIVTFQEVNQAERRINYCVPVGMWQWFFSAGTRPQDNEFAIYLDDHLVHREYPKFDLRGTPDVRSGSFLVSLISPPPPAPPSPPPKPFPPGVICGYKLRMYDTHNDGWDGAKMSICEVEVGNTCTRPWSSNPEYRIGELYGPQEEDSRCESLHGGYPTRDCRRRKTVDLCLAEDKDYTWTLTNGLYRDEVSWELFKNDIKIDEMVTGDYTLYSGTSPHLRIGIFKRTPYSPPPPPPPLDLGPSFSIHKTGTMSTVSCKEHQLSKVVLRSNDDGKQKQGTFKMCAAGTSNCQVRHFA
jgi:hypothetical protein